MISKLLRVFALAMLAFASSAQAEWRQARTNHFILTIDDTEDSARDFATRLERFDAAMRVLYSVPDDPDQHARPIAIYVWRADLFREVCACPYALGFYRPRAEGSFVFLLHDPESDAKAQVGSWSSQTLLLHEYTHHFTFSNFPIAYSYWFKEGFAEFNAGTSFEKDGSVVIGYPINYRAKALTNGITLSPKQLFDPHLYGFVDNTEVLYGRGWLLTHYLILNPKRKGQLAAYIAAMNKGASGLAAAESAFGDLKALNRELDAYQRGRLAPPLRIPQKGSDPKVAISSLSPGLAAMMPIKGLMMRGIADGFGLSFANRANKIASGYPDDPDVQFLLAQAEFRRGALEKAEKANDRALSLSPNLVDALLMKGMIAQQRARTTNATDPAVWKAARAWFLKANRLDPNAVMPLYLYYASFEAAKTKPSPDAIKGLMRAAVLAPESGGIRIALARQMLADGDAKAARTLLQPSAFEPHRKADKNVPLQLINLIDAGKLDEAKTLASGRDDEDE